MVDDEAPRTPEETRDFIRDTLQNAVGDMGDVLLDKPMTQGGE